MIRRVFAAITVLTLVIQLGCGGDSTPPPAAATNGPPAAPVTGVTGPPPTVEPTPAVPTVTDVFSVVPESATGAISIRVPKVLASPFAKSDATAKLKDEVRAQAGLEVDQVDELIVVFTGQGGAAAYPTGSPYTTGRPNEERGTGRPTGSPYGPPVGGPSPTDMGSQAAMAGAMAPMMPTADSMLMIVRANTPLDQTKIRAANKLQPTETEAGTLKYSAATAPADPAMCFFDDRTLIIAKEATLQSVLSQAGMAAPVVEGTTAPKPLSDKLRTAPPELAVYGTMKFGNLQLGALPTDAAGPPGMNPTAMMSEMTSKIPGGAFSLDFTSGVKLVVDLETADEAAAQEMWTQLQGALAMAGPLVAAQKLQDPPGATDEQKALRAKGFEAWDQFSKTLKVEKGGEGNVHVLVSGSLDQPMVESLANMMKKDVFMPPGSAPAKLAVSNQLKQIGLAAHKYLGETTKFPTAAKLSADGKPLLSWRVMLLPHLGQQELYDQFKLDEPWDSEHNKTLIDKMPSVYSMPGVNEPGKTTVLAPIAEGTAFGNQEGATLLMASDGTSNTILLVEANADRAVTWTAPEDLQFDPAKPTDGIDKVYPGVFLALWMDGQVHDIALNTDKKTVASLFTYAGGEPPVNLAELIAAAATAAAAPPEVAASGEASAGEDKYGSGWEGDAKRALDRGHDKEAARLAMAAAIVADEEVVAEETMLWNKLKRPLPFLRWGIIAMPDPTRRQDPPSSTGAPAATEDAEADPEKEFYDLTGDVGREMVQELRERLDDGKYGKIFEFDRAKPDAAEGGSEFADRRVETRTPYGPTTNPSSASGALEGTPDEIAEKAPRGLVILGKAEKKALQEKAAEAEVDLLLVAKMTTKNSRSTDPAIEFYVVEVASKKTVVRDSDPIPTSGAATTNTYGYTGAPAATSASGDDEARRKNKAKWLKQLDDFMEFTELPKLPEDKVLAQAKKIVGKGGQENPLPVLLELRFYIARGLLPPAEALPLLEKVLGDGDQAKTFLEGSEEERKQLLEKFLLPVPKDEPKTDS